MSEPAIKMLPIQEIAAKLGIEEQYIDYYGRYSAKVRLELLDRPGAKSKGKLILVTAINPTASGEGKTVCSIGLTLGLNRIGKKAVVTSREPSLGPVFGVKGGATGGGKSLVLPSEKINLHFNGDFHAVTAAHNLAAAMLDAHVFHGNKLRIDVGNVSWPRTIDMNDRALREIVVALGGRTNGTARETGFVITAASEIMAILALSSDREDLRRRLGEIVLGYDLDRAPVRVRDIGATGAMMVLMQDAILPNLVQTSENTPAFVHAGPFGNIAHGTSSVISHRMGMQLAEYVVNECGFGADLGAEKYLDIVMPSSGIKPSAAVVVASVKALASHGASAGAPDSMEALKAGLANLGRHLENLRKYTLQPVVAVNRFPNDTPEQLEVVKSHCKDLGFDAAVADVFSLGGAGAIELAEKVVAAAEKTDPAKVQPLYTPEMSFEDKIKRVATEIYGAGKVVIEDAAKKKLARYTELGYGHFPVCMAKTQYSFSDNPKLLGAPTGHTFTVTDANLSAGAGFVVPIGGNMMLMPGLGKVPQAVKMDLDAAGNIVGM
ncbi:MAG: formate--tetrahydrofolate ligase [Acidobacteriales bacterium]|nr:formate--tetrahydrofolate ligase [Terriglobales bacterium]